MAATLAAARGGEGERAEAYLAGFGEEERDGLVEDSVFVEDDLVLGIREQVLRRVRGQSSCRGQPDCEPEQHR